MKIFTTTFFFLQKKTDCSSLAFMHIEEEAKSETFMCPGKREGSKKMDDNHAISPNVVDVKMEALKLYTAVIN